MDGINPLQTVSTSGSSGTNDPFQKQDQVFITTEVRADCKATEGRKRPPVPGCCFTRLQNDEPIKQRTAPKEKQREINHSWRLGRPHHADILHTETGFMFHLLSVCACAQTMGQAFSRMGDRVARHAPLPPDQWQENHENDPEEDGVFGNGGGQTYQRVPFVCKIVAHFGMFPPALIWLFVSEGWTLYLLGKLRKVLDMTDNQTTHFGFETVPEGDKAGLVQGVFSSVASKYDVMNDAMSLGIHRIWKEAMMDWLAPRSGQKLLDVAGGTGDISFRFLKRAKVGYATVLDITEPMLIEGRKRAEAAQMDASLDWIVGDAMALPFEDNTFDVYTISFGIRNVTRPQEALNEAYRVLKPGGRLMVLEFSHIPNDMLQKMYDLYSFNAIPAMGKIITGDRDSYQYLVESIRNFPDQETFIEMVRTAGFENAKYRNLSLGIACLHSGWKL
jgi:demethylmenaquinone methyltransferase/2-methoxy-6-polyprenyl-1,4-benzoquinol methylase